jgi:hypothetical protein
VRRVVGMRRRRRDAIVMLSDKAVAVDDER